MFSIYIHFSIFLSNPFLSPSNPTRSSPSHFSIFCLLSIDLPYALLLLATPFNWTQNHKLSAPGGSKGVLSIWDESQLLTSMAMGSNQHFCPPRSPLAFLSLSELILLKVADSWQFQEIFQRMTPKNCKKRNYKDMSEKKKKTCFTGKRRKITCFSLTALI